LCKTKMCAVFISVTTSKSPENSPHFLERKWRK
jgi:hypothetical protein